MKKFFTLLWLALAAFTFKATAQTTTCNANFTAQFLTNTTVKFNPASMDSLPVAYHTWTFGDGSPVSHNVSPTHTFAVGSYAVVHTIVRPGTNGTTQCSQSFTLQIVIQDCNLNVDFNWTVAAGNGLTYAFHNLSTPLSPTDSITWIFGDGATSHDVNPTHTYANYGTYNVCLIVKKNNNATTAPCVKYICKTITSVQPCNLVVDFNWTVSATNPLSYEFHNLSTPSAATDSTIWSFGDGSSSTAANPTHVYANAGTYTICLTVKKLTVAGAPTCVRYLCKTIVVQNPCNLVVDFGWNALGSNPMTIAFQNLSTPLSPTDSITWTFGDGTTSHDVNPTHTYANGGAYTVCLKVKKNNNNTTAPCVRDICKTVVVTPPCNLVVDFSWNITGAGPVVVAFTNLSTPLALTDSITWTFGDGTSSHDVNPVHTYTAGGSYNVCLVVKKNNNAPGSPACIRYICKTVVIQTPCNLVVDFSSTASTANPLTVIFHNLSTPLSPTDSITWTFGDGTTSHDVNPTHTYAQPGSYTVCLKVKKVTSNTSAPCVRDICKTIVVQTPPCNLVVDFSWNVTSSSPYTVAFTNLSTPLSPSDSITWTFGDGTVSHDVNPTHTYTAAGSYTVCLKVKKATSNTTFCIKDICKTVVIPQPCNLVVDFSWNTVASSPLTIHFNNLSTPLNPTDSITWTFGDGTNSHDVNPTHTYANAGTYTVCLIVKKNNVGTTPCIKYICKTVSVQAPCTLVANFTWVTPTANSLSIYFNNTSTGASANDSVRWTFGDGTSSNQYNTNHTYAQPGTYTVCLRMQKRNPNGTLSNCVSEKCQAVTVQSSCNFQATWTWHLDSVNVKKVYFNNTTVIPVAGTALWTFGDGTSATTWNAVHEYANSGRYYVCLRVEMGPNCVRYKCDSITVPVPAPPCNNQSNFTVVATTSNSQTFTFIPAYQSNTVTYTWSFGDGTGSNAMIATHHYNLAGTYNACLTVWRNNNCVSTTCKTVTVASQVNCDSIHVGYTYQVDPNLPNKLYFYANANFPILDQTWTITRLPASTPPNQVILHANNPSYVFNDTGYYNVCLRAVTLGGCIKEYCSVVHITQIPAQCLLAAYPNPATSEVHINVPLTAPDMVNVYVYNNLNVQVLEKHQQGSIGNNVVTLNIAALVSGYYTVRVIYGNHICNLAFQKL